MGARSPSFRTLPPGKGVSGRSAVTRRTAAQPAVGAAWRTNGSPWPSGDGRGPLNRKLLDTRTNQKHSHARSSREVDIAKAKEQFQRQLTAPAPPSATRLKPWPMADLRGST